MHKNTFLESKDVAEFIDWLGGVARNETGYRFSHSYYQETKGRSDKSIPWTCDNLFDAKEKYRWPFRFYDFYKKHSITGSSYHENEVVLTQLSNALIESIAIDDADDCYKACIMIVDWGGVIGSDTRGNKKLLNELGDNISCYLAEVKKLFESGDAQLTRHYFVNTSRASSIPIIMNAGFTKIYSLMCNNFIIYDGRVGAALSLLVRRFYEQYYPLERVSENLGFYFGKAKNSKVNRNPSTHLHKFKALSASYPVHIRNNLKANWILEKVLEGDCGQFKYERHPMRALEAALFMIGYRI